MVRRGKSCQHWRHFWWISVDEFERPRAISAWTVIHNCHNQSINGVFGGPSLQGNENKLFPRMLAFAGSSSCTDYSTRERIATYVAGFIYQAPFHRPNCDEDHSFKFCVGFSRYIRRICVSQDRVTSEINLRVTPCFRRSSLHLSRYLVSPWVKCYSGCLPRAWRSPSIIEVRMFRRQRESDKNARKLTRTWTSERGVLLKFNDDTALSSPLVVGRLLDELAALTDL